MLRVSERLAMYRTHFAVIGQTALDFGGPCAVAAIEVEMLSKRQQTHIANQRGKIAVLATAIVGLVQANRLR